MLLECSSSDNSLCSFTPDCRHQRNAPYNSRLACCAPCHSAGQFAGSWLFRPQNRGAAACLEGIITAVRIGFHHLIAASFFCSPPGPCSSQCQEWLWHHWPCAIQRQQAHSAPVGRLERWWSSTDAGMLEPLEGSCGRVVEHIALC